MQGHAHSTTGQRPDGMSADMQECIRNCAECHDVCLQTIAYCLNKGGKHAEAGHIITLMDCVQACHTSEDFMLRGSTMHAVVCGMCAEACRRCAEDCERMSDDDTMRRCAEVCRRCEDSCRRMAAMA